MVLNFLKDKKTRKAMPVSIIATHPTHVIPMNNMAINAD